MLALKPNCECCDADLPADSPDARICSLECTYCKRCAEHLLGYRCASCGDQLQTRPARQGANLASHPASTERVTRQHTCTDYLISDQLLRTNSGELHGTLLLPSKKPRAWALLIAGAGPSDRNGNAPGSRSNCLQYLALALAAQGIATLRYDKRGVGASAAAGSKEALLTFEHHIEDAKAWFAALRLRATGPVAIVGHSEGAQIAAHVAEKLAVAGLVNLCGTSRPLDQLLLEQLEEKLPADQLQQAKDILAYLYELSATEAERRPRGVLFHRKGARAKAPVVPPVLAPVFRASLHPYLVSRMRERPDLELARVKCAVLLVSGGSDRQISEGDSERLVRVKPEAEVVRVAGMNHVLKGVGEDLGAGELSYFDVGVGLDEAVGGLIGGFLLGLG